MKKTSLIVVAALCVVCHLSAAEFNWKQLGDLYRSGDYANLETTAFSMRPTAKNISSKGAIISYVVLARQRLGRYADSDAAIADIDALAKEFNLAGNSDPVQALKLSVLFTRRENAKAVELSANWTGKRTLHRRAIALADLGRYAEASATYAASGDHGTLVLAAQTALRAKLPEKVFEYSLQAFSSGDIKDPAAAIKLVNAVLDADSTGTAATSA